MWSIFLIVIALVGVHGHGRVLQPPSRASAWRYNFGTKPNYDDDGLNCGGFATQYERNNGKCGICGDAYDEPSPRRHELGGEYGTGVIVGSYQAGSVLSTLVEISAFHQGYWEFKICTDPYNNNQACFDQHPLELVEGGTKYYPNHREGRYEVNYRIPAYLACEHCVLQWRYTAGNNWGVCANGTQGLGCGNQETFGACSDITIASPLIIPEYKPIDISQILMIQDVTQYLNGQAGKDEYNVDND